MNWNLKKRLRNDRRYYLVIKESGTCKELDYEQTLESQGRKAPMADEALKLPDGRVLAIWPRDSPTPLRLGAVKLDPRSYRAADVKNIEGPLLPRLLRRALIGKESLSKKEKWLIVILAVLGAGVVAIELIPGL